MKTKTKARAKTGFTYLWEIVAPDGTIKDKWIDHNLMPTQGLNYMISSAIAGGAQILTWYIGVYEANYAPVPADTAATFPTAASESTAYAASTRVQFVTGSVAMGSVDNTASRAEFLFNADKTIRGAFVISSAAKQSTSGVLLSAEQFPSPKLLTAGDTLRVTAGFDIISI